MRDGERERVSLPAHVLPELAPMLSGWVRVASASMVPLLRPGDEVALQAGVPQPGAIVLVDHEGYLLLHRLLRRDEHGLWLGGDATASWEGPFADRAWPVATVRRRGGHELTLTASRWHRGLGWLLPRLAGGRVARRGLAWCFRRLAGPAATGDR